LLVLTDKESRVLSLREANIKAEMGAIEDPDVVRQQAGEVDTVIIAGDKPYRNRQLASVATEAYPDAFIMGYTGDHASSSDRSAMADLVDETIDYAAAVADSLVDSIYESGYRTRQLLRVLRQLEGPLAIVTHDNPDPDAIASAMALARLAKRAAIETEVCYFGDISHQENRAFVNLLEYRLTKLHSETDLSQYGSFALVDHSRPGVNDGLPSETNVALVLDHHPPRGPAKAQFFDLRSDVGATSTLLTDHLRRVDIEPNERLATGLLFGIRVDTNDFAREVCLEDFRSAAYLLDYVDTDTLELVESPSMSPETLDTIGAAIDNRVVKADVLATCAGGSADRDALAQAADKLLDLDGVRTTFVFGYTDKTVYASARTRGTDIDIGETLRDAFDQVGSAGGHADMAGAQLPVGMLVDSDDDEPATAVTTAVTERFFEAIESRPSHRPPEAFDDTRYTEPGGPEHQSVEDDT
jgi:nanoRNase/pAp phosphatase (c-di-AMP/oligoRNAs hydrolase)